MSTSRAKHSSIKVTPEALEQFFRLCDALEVCDFLHEADKDTVERARQVAERLLVARVIPQSYGPRLRLVKG
jgi:hypothetical protein